MSLDSYNKFLVRKTKFGIKNIDKIYSDIMHADAIKSDEMIKSINEHLGGQAQVVNFATISFFYLFHLTNYQPLYRNSAQ